MSETHASFISGRDPGDESPTMRADRLPAVEAMMAIEAPLTDAERVCDYPLGDCYRIQVGLEERGAARFAALRQSRARAVRAWRERKHQARRYQVEAATVRHWDGVNDVLAARLAAVTAEREAVRDTNDALADELSARMAVVEAARSIINKLAPALSNDLDDDGAPAVESVWRWNPDLRRLRDALAALDAARPGATEGG